MIKIVSVLLTFVIFAVLSAVAIADGGDGADEGTAGDVSASTPTPVPPVLLEKTGDRFSLRVPSQLSAGAQLTPLDGSDPVTMTRLGGSSFGAVAVVNDNPVVNYPDQNVVMFPFDSGGYALLEVIEGINSAEVFQYRIDTGDNRQIIPSESEGYNILDADGNAVVSIGSPWAFDMNGQAVPVYYTLDNNILKMTVDHQDGGYSYPIVADPCFFWETDCWDQITDAIGSTSLSDSTHNAAALGGFMAGTIAGAATLNPIVAASTAATAYVQVVVVGISVVSGIHCAVTCEPTSELEREPF